MRIAHRVLAYLIVFAGICISGCNSPADGLVDHAVAEVPLGLDAFFPIKVDGGYNIIDRNGRVLFKAPFARVSQAYAHDIPVSPSSFVGQRSVLLVSERHWVFVNQEGARGVEPPVDSMDDFRQVINLGDSLFVLTSKLKATGVPGIAAETVFDPTGRWKPTDKLIPCSLITESIVPVRNGKLCGFADREGTVLIEPQFEDCQPFFEGLAAVKSKGLWGFINKQGGFVIDAKFDKVGRFDRGRAHVLLPNQVRSVFVAPDETQIGEFALSVEGRNQEVFLFNEGLCPVQVTPRPGADDTNYLMYDNSYLLAHPVEEASHFSESGLAIVQVYSTSANTESTRSRYILNRNGELGPEIPIILGCTPRNGFTLGLAGCHSGYINEQGKIVWGWAQNPQ